VEPRRRARSNASSRTVSTATAGSSRLALRTRPEAPRVGRVRSAEEKRSAVYRPVALPVELLDPSLDPLPLVVLRLPVEPLPLVVPVELLFELLDPSALPLISPSPVTEPLPLVVPFELPLSEPVVEPSLEPLPLIEPLPPMEPLPLIVPVELLPPDEPPAEPPLELCANRGAARSRIPEIVHKIVSLICILLADISLGF
jgi:hypothetical protein